MAITFRGSKGSSLTHNELDQNFREFFHSASYEGSTLKLHKFTAISSSVSVPLTNPVGRNGAIQFKLGSAVSGANAQFTGSQNLTFVENRLKVTGSIILDTENESGIFEVTGSGKLTGDLTVGGTLTAEEFVTERNTTIQIYNSGSSTLGDSADDIHLRTGSLRVSGSFDLTGPGIVTNMSGSFSGSFEGEGSGVTGIISSSYSVTASYSNTSTSASHAVNADIAPFSGLTGKPTLLSSSIQIGSDISGSINALSASFVTTASATLNDITFTQGDGSTFVVTVDTGSGVGSGMSDLVDDTTPQLGGNLDLNSRNIIGTGSINIIGNITGSNVKSIGDVNAVDSTLTGTITAATASFGPVSASIIQASGDITAFYSSDERLKDNVTPIASALDKINSIGGYEFDWNSNSEHSGHDVGVIAQEIEKVLPEVVAQRDNGYLAVRYEKIVALLIQAIKEQQSQIDDLKSRLD